MAMNDVGCRSIGADEIPQAVEVYLEALTEMRARHGIVAPAPPFSVAEVTYRHVFETGIFEVGHLSGPSLYLRGTTLTAARPRTGIHRAVRGCAPTTEGLRAAAASTGKTGSIGPVVEGCPTWTVRSARARFFRKTSMP